MTNDDMPWVNLTQEEVEELRNKKHELTEYGKQKLKQMMTHEEMFEEAERREAERKALDAVEKLYKENGDALKQLAEIEKEEREKLNAGFKQDENGKWYRPTLQELTRNERIELAEKEIAYMVMGGQDGREYANSIAFILQVLDSLRDD
jgi:acyl-CoA reductase-like NAD-dependent aldehyde dehydrogenase